MSAEKPSEIKPKRNFNHNLLTALSLAAIILLGIFFRFYQLGATSLGNSYYAATVKSMLTSWHNFFFVSYEPGGSVSVDKPPLGFWIEAISAYFFGLTGFSLALPNALAGTFSIPMLYSLVKKQFGTLSGLAAALVLAVTPITIATERNNTIDGMLVFVLLAATWFTWKSVENGKLRYLLMGAIIIGLGFNIKMLQAYMVLPAIYLLYFFGAKHRWPKRITHLGIATVLLLAVSLSWALIVDSVPAENRPFIGSSTDNTVTELIIGHNGIKRLLGGPGSGIAPENGQFANNNQRDNGNGNDRESARADLPSKQDGLPGQTPPAGSNQPGGANEVGIAGWLRLFSEPLAAQGSWLLPLALLGVGLILYGTGYQGALTNQHLALILWTAWLLPISFYFTFTKGLWHTYYLIMLGPPLAALVGATLGTLDSVVNLQPAPARQAMRSDSQNSYSDKSSFEKTSILPTPRTAWFLVALLSSITVAFEIFIASAYPNYFVTISTLILLFWFIGISLLWIRPQTWSLVVVMLSLLIGPLIWSGLTTFNPQPEVNLPKAGPMTGQPGNGPTGISLSPTQKAILTYLLSNTNPDTYLAATLDSHGASPFILATGRPFLTLGGFIGRDEVVSVTTLQKMISTGSLRFILDNGNLKDKQAIFNWVSSSCKIVEVPGVQSFSKNSSLSLPSGGPQNQKFTALYDCGY